jgi:hypothetical protein
MASSANLSAIVTNLGAYYQEHRDEIFSDALLGLEPVFNSQGVELMDGVADEVPLLNLTMGNILQPGDYESTNFTNDVMNFDNRKLKVKPVKSDLKIFPQDFERKWITYNRTKKATMKDWQDIPFHQFLMQQINAKIKEELNLATWIANTASGTANYTKICDGVITNLKADVATGDVTQIGDGTVIDNMNVVEILEGIADGITDANAGQMNHMYVSPSVARWYVRADTSTIGRGGVDFNGIPSTLNGEGFPEFVLRGTNCRIHPVPALSKAHTGLAEEAVIVSVGKNIIVGTDTMSEINDMDFQKVDRYIKILIDFKWGVNYRLANAARRPIFVNNGAGWV